MKDPDNTPNIFFYGNIENRFGGLSLLIYHSWCNNNDDIGDSYGGIMMVIIMIMVVG